MDVGQDGEDVNQAKIKPQASTIFFLNLFTGLKPFSCALSEVTVSVQVCVNKVKVNKEKQRQTDEHVSTLAVEILATVLPKLMLVQTSG